MDSRIGQLVLFIGVAIGISAGAQLPAKGETWSGSAWVAIIGFIIGIIGLIMWRMSLSANRQRSDTSTGPAASGAVLKLRAVNDQLMALCGAASDMQAAALAAAIEQLRENHTGPLLADTDAIQAELGARAPAFLTGASEGVSLVGRAQSMAYDGYPDHAREVLAAALKQLQAVASA